MMTNFNCLIANYIRVLQKKNRTNKMKEGEEIERGVYVSRYS